MWYLGVVLNNMLSLFDSLFSDVDQLKASMESSGLGYKHWFQDELGGVLMLKGLRLAKERCMQRAASTITRFIRFCGQNSTTDTSGTTRNSSPPITRHVQRRVNLSDRSNTPPIRNLGGRPRKRKRKPAGPGRPRSDNPPKPKRKTINATLREYLDSFAFADAIPHFVPKRHGRKKKNSCNQPQMVCNASHTRTCT